MLQLTPQMKILVAVEPIDGRKGIDSLAQLRNVSRVLRRFFVEFSVVGLCCGGRGRSVSSKPPGRVKVGDGLDNFGQFVDGLSQQSGLS